MIRQLLVGLLLGLTLGACSQEERTILRLSAYGFSEQAVTAIESVRAIYKLSSPTRPPDESRSLLVNRLLQSKVDFRDVRRIDTIITGARPSETQTSELDEAFNDLIAQYEATAAIFNNIEKVGLLGSGAIADAAQPARSLTVKMSLLAKRLSQDPPTPLDPARVVLSRRLRDLRRRYDDPKTTEAERREIQTQVSQQIDEWLQVDAQERQLLCETTARLVRAAETGQQLSTLIDQYRSVSFDKVVNTVTQLFGTASSLTGRDYSLLTARIQRLDSAIKQDPTLNAIANELPQQFWRTSNQQPLTETRSLQCQP